MKTFLRIAFLFASVFILAITTSMAQRVLKGTVYIDGELAAGVTVEANRGGSMMTSFDGMYEVEGDVKSKWIKFTFINDVQRLVIEDKTGDTFDYAMSGEIPTAGSNEESKDVNLKSAQELLSEQNRDYMNELSLYTEFYKQDDFKSAIPHWKKVYNKYPKSSQNIYIQGIKMHQSLIDNAQSEEEKDQSFQELMNIFDKRMKYFGQRGYVQGRKGTAFLKYKLETDRMLENEELKETHKSSYEWLSESVAEMGTETETPVLVLFMQTSKALFKMGEMPKETVVVNYEKCNSIINAVIEKNADAQSVEKVKEAQSYIENIFGSSGAADCESLISFLAPQFQEKGEDIDFVKSMLRRLRRANCDETPLFSEATEKLYNLEPSAEAAFNMARRYLKRNEVEKAKGYYKQAMEQETDQDLLATYYFEYALFIYAKENDFPEARSFARKALAINSTYCEALMLVGDIYVASSRSFSGDDFEKATVFWVAVDYYNRARRGEDCSIDASKKASDYKKYFPNKEVAFMNSIQEGASYKVGGWINETTKVRF